MQFQTFQGAILTQNLEKSQKDVTFIGIWGVRGGPLGTHFRYFWVPFFDDVFGKPLDTILHRFWYHFGFHFGGIFSDFSEPADLVNIELPLQRELNS